MYNRALEKNSFLSCKCVSSVSRSGMQAIQLEIPEGTEIFEDARSSPPKKNSIDSGSSEPLDDSFRPR